MSSILYITVIGRSPSNCGGYCFLIDSQSLVPALYVGHTTWMKSKYYLVQYMGLRAQYWY